MTVSLADPENMELFVFVPTLRVEQGVIRVENEKPMRVAWERNSLRFEDVHLTGDGLDLALYGAVEGEETFIGISAEADLSIAQEFVPAIAEATGTVELELELAGGLAHPRLLGYLSLADGAVDIINFPQPTEDISLEVTIADGTLYVETLSAKTGGGLVTGGGEVKLDGFKPAETNLFLRGRKINTGYDPYTEATIGKMDVLLTGKEGLYDLSGDVYLDKAVYSRAIDWRELLAAFETKPRTAAQVFDKDETPKFMTLNIAVHADDNLKFESNLADIEAGAELIVLGDNRRVGLVGDVTVLEGEAQVLEREYEVVSGQVQFFDETRVYPIFDITAETETDELFITVNVSGNADKLNFYFSSDPPRSDQDVIAFLLLGIDYTEFQQVATGESGDDAAATGAAYQAAAQVLGVSRYANRYVGVRISVDTSTGEPRLKVTRELQKNLYYHQFLPLMGTTLEGQLEYTFFSFVSLVGIWRTEDQTKDQPDPQSFGAGIRFSVEFQ